MPAYYPTNLSRIMKKEKNPLVFLDVSIDGDAAEKIVIEVIFLPKALSTHLRFQYTLHHPSPLLLSNYVYAVVY